MSDARLADLRARRAELILKRRDFRNEIRGSKALLKLLGLKSNRLVDGGSQLFLAALEEQILSVDREIHTICSGTRAGGEHALLETADLGYPPPVWVCSTCEYDAGQVYRHLTVHGKRDRRYKDNPLVCARCGDEDRRAMPCAWLDIERFPSWIGRFSRINVSVGGIHAGSIRHRERCRIAVPVGTFTLTASAVFGSHFAECSINASQRSVCRVIVGWSGSIWFWWTQKLVAWVEDEPLAIAAPISQESEGLPPEPPGTDPSPASASPAGEGMSHPSQRTVLLPATLLAAGEPEAQEASRANVPEETREAASNEELERIANGENFWEVLKGRHSR